MTADVDCKAASVFANGGAPIHAIPHFLGGSPTNFCVHTYTSLAPALRVSYNHHRTKAYLQLFIAI
jgi:hypothetical protein